MPFQGRDVMSIEHAWSLDGTLYTHSSLKRIRLGSGRERPNGTVNVMEVYYGRATKELVSSMRLYIGSLARLFISRPPGIPMKRRNIRKT